MIWTLALVSTGLTGVWLAARHWYGWLIYTLNEVLWLAYGIHLHAPPLWIMAILWGAIGLRNLRVSFKASLA